MILAVDVQYAENRATVAGVEFAQWQADAADRELVSFVEGVAQYEPGQFYRRELPCIIRLMEEHELRPEYVVIDGLVYLDGFSRAGLGRHLFDALGRRVPVIGVAKKRFAGIGAPYEVYRGSSKRPLLVTAAGIDVELAKEYIAGMHGRYRLPTLLKRADQLCRAAMGGSWQELGELPARSPMP